MICVIYSGLTVVAVVLHGTGGGVPFGGVEERLERTPRDSTLMGLHCITPRKFKGRDQEDRGMEETSCFGCEEWVGFQTTLAGVKKE